MRTIREYLQASLDILKFSLATRQRKMTLNNVYLPYVTYKLINWVFDWLFPSRWISIFENSFFLIGWKSGTRFLSQSCNRKPFTFRHLTNIMLSELIPFQPRGSDAYHPLPTVHLRTNVANTKQCSRFSRCIYIFKLSWASLSMENVDPDF